MDLSGLNPSQTSHSDLDKDSSAEESTGINNEDGPEKTLDNKSSESLH